MTYKTIPAKHYIECNRCGAQIDGSVVYPGWTRLTIEAPREYHKEYKALDACPECSKNILMHIDELFRPS